MRLIKYNSKCFTGFIVWVGLKCSLLKTSEVEFSSEVGRKWRQEAGVSQSLQLISLTVADSSATCRRLVPAVKEGDEW